MRLNKYGSGFTVTATEILEWKQKRCLECKARQAADFMCEEQCDNEYCYPIAKRCLEALKRMYRHPLMDTWCVEGEEHGLDSRYT